MKQTEYEPADITIYLRDKGIVVKEKSILAYRMEDKGGRILAVGMEALTGSFPEETVICNPFHQGAVEDFTVASKIMKTFVQRALKQNGIGWKMRRPVIGACIPSDLSLVTIKAYEDMFYYVGAKEVVRIQQSKQESLATASEAEKKKYTLIISVGKDDPLAYVRERAKETVAYAKAMGVSKEALLDMISEVRENE